MPWTGSWQSGPWAVASWNAYEILSEKVEGWTVSARDSTSWLPTVGVWLSSCKLIDID